MKDRKKRWALFWITMFLVYMVLSTFNLLLSNYYFQGDRIVKVIGGLTDFETFDSIWTPGWLLGYLLGTSFGNQGTFLGQIITFLIGALIILRLFNISLKELADNFDNLIKRRP
ncbi:MAG: hypothetical protein C0490_17170 [Marivirga sp.]|nr:hypothetical protein [Marivirga sp.]